uniref:Peptidase S1 domain-containing protein n=1 Tax=Amphilophus citrinellus TaxID=61819 RepID=A0A3Q0S318_AMPCI
MAFCKLLLTALVLLHNSGMLGGEIKSSIIGGADAPKGKWPWMVSLNMTTSDKLKKWRCGGTIVSKDWILTAAHCLDNNPSHHRSFVVVGARDLHKGAERYMQVTHFVPHPDYKALGNGVYINDIALIKLKKTIDFSKDVNKVSLPSDNDAFGPSSECWITGWGYVKSNVPLPDPETLQEAKISIMDQTACKNVYSQLTSEMLCAGGSNGGKDACNGDYGGPLVCRKGTEFVQVGVMSYGSRNGCGLRPGVYTQVSKYLTFINYYIHHTEETSAEV